VSLDTLTLDTNSAEVPMVPWQDFVEAFQWSQGEHVALIGPTGSGKTNLAYWLLPKRRYIVVFGTKPKDPSLVAFGKHNGFQILRTWNPKTTAQREPRRILWPDASNLDSDRVQRSVFSMAMAHMYRQGGWCLYIDELWYLCQILGLTKAVKVYLLQARAMEISLVVATQRPAWVPVEVYDQSTHLFFWRDSDSRNLRRLAELSVINAETIMWVLARLPKYHVLYVNTRTGEMMITRPPAPEKGNK